jgi:hypothetical protein
VRLCQARGNPGLRRCPDVKESAVVESIHAQLEKAGIPLDHHESDLYAKVTPESKAIVEKYEHFNAVTIFSDAHDHTPWYDIPFAFDPVWHKTDPKEIRRLIKRLDEYIDTNVLAEAVVDQMVDAEVPLTIEAARKIWLGVVEQIPDLIKETIERVDSL